MNELDKLTGLSHEAQLAMLYNTQQHIIETLKRIEESVRGLDKSNHDAALSSVEMSGRVKRLEDSMNANAPTIQEFVTIKHKVQGAGKLGTFLWAAGAVLLTWVASSREAIFMWLTGK